MRSHFFPQLPNSFTHGVPLSLAREPSLRQRSFTELDLDSAIEGHAKLLSAPAIRPLKNAPPPPPFELPPSTPSFESLTQLPSPPTSPLDMNSAINSPPDLSLESLDDEEEEAMEVESRDENEAETLLFNEQEPRWSLRLNSAARCSFLGFSNCSRAADGQIWSYLEAYSLPEIALREG